MVNATSSDFATALLSHELVLVGVAVALLPVRLEVAAGREAELRVDPIVGMVLGSIPAAGWTQ
jgi:hypothetical protein